MYELLPFWHTLFENLGFDVIVSPESDRTMYQNGQSTIPSDTVCFPAKLTHGHIDWLTKQNTDAIFYPCMSYNIDEGLGDNHYNCPVVAYYPEVLVNNCFELNNQVFIYDYVDPQRRKDFTKRFPKILENYFPQVKDCRKAIDAAYEEYEKHMRTIREEGMRMMKQAEEEGKHVIVLAGRPYHIDPEVNHGIDGLITRNGAYVITEDSISHLEEKFPTSVLNQWTYHSRLYAAARYCTEHDNLDLVQLVSFGCGLDAITTDETKEILQRKGKLYTQLKIDEITNLGAVNIRIRSLFAALEEKGRNDEH
jgi:predicted nucleotide-binding protein (sugar kinase/HSP70/actin superfamily)